MFIAKSVEDIELFNFKYILLFVFIK